MKKREIRMLASALHAREGEVVIEVDAKVTREVSVVDGAWVGAWVWVAYGDKPFIELLESALSNDE